MPHGIYRVLCFVYAGTPQTAQQTNRHEMHQPWITMNIVAMP